MKNKCEICGKEVSNVTPTKSYVVDDRRYDHCIACLMTKANKKNKLMELNKSGVYYNEDDDKYYQYNPDKKDTLIKLEVEGEQFPNRSKYLERLNTDTEYWVTFRDCAISATVKAYTKEAAKEKFYEGLVDYQVNPGCLTWDDITAKPSDKI